MFFIVPCFDNDCILYGMNRIFELSSWDILQSRYFKILALSGEM